MSIRFQIIKLCIFLLGIVFYSSVIADDRDALHFVVNLEPKLPLKKDLDKLASDMEKTATIYKTTNQKAYWENEARKSFQKLLYSYGYYASTIDVDMAEEDSKNIMFNIIAGDRYKIVSVSIKHDKNSNKNIVMPASDYLKIKAGNFVFAKSVLNDQKRLHKFIETNNCLRSLSVTNQAVINHINKEIEITFLIDAGPTATVEKVEFTGLKNVKPGYARKLVKISDGQCFREPYVVEAQKYLQKSGLFSSAATTIPESVSQDGSVPIVFNLIERKARSIKAGVSYGTDFGPGVTLGWEHRNFFGSGEEVKVDLLSNQKQQTLDLSYVKPFFKRDDQLLRLGSTFENSKSKAFDSREGSISGFIERELSPKWRAGVGSRFLYATVKDIAKNKENKVYSLFSTPLFLTHDTRDNILDSTRGHEAKLDVSPFFSVQSKEKPFLKSQIALSTYFSAKKVKMKPTLALKAATGSIMGVKSAKVPTVEKFYVGGSSSVRGYAYQLVGNLDNKNRPIGGRSFIETAIELRLKVSDTISVVGFLDSGFAYSSLIPDRKQALLHGAGVGLRYSTGFGPLRADIGFPLKRRKFVDKSFQLYFGIGQSF